MASQVMVIADSFAYEMVICKGKAASDCLKHYVFFAHVTGTMKTVLETVKSILVHKLS